MGVYTDEFQPGEGLMRESTLDEVCLALRDAKPEKLGGAGFDGVVYTKDNRDISSIVKPDSLTVVEELEHRADYVIFAKCFCSNGNDSGLSGPCVVVISDKSKSFTTSENGGPKRNLPSSQSEDTVQKVRILYFMRDNRRDEYLATQRLMANRISLQGPTFDQFREGVENDRPESLRPIFSNDGIIVSAPNMIHLYDSMDILKTLLSVESHVEIPDVVTFKVDGRTIRLTRVEITLHDKKGNPYLGYSLKVEISD